MSWAGFFMGKSCSKVTQVDIILLCKVSGEVLSHRCQVTLVKRYLVFSLQLQGQQSFLFTLGLSFYYLYIYKKKKNIGIIHIGDTDPLN